MGGVRRWSPALTPSLAPEGPEGEAWILRTVSIPEVTRPNTAKPWPSGFLWPPKSISGWSPMHIENPDVAESGEFLGIESAPSTCFKPVSLVRSSGIGPNDFPRNTRLT